MDAQKLTSDNVRELVGSKVVAVLTRYTYNQGVGIVGEVSRYKECGADVYDILAIKDDVIESSARLYPPRTCRKDGKADIGEGHFKHGTVVKLTEDGKPSRIFIF